ncbi:BID domain-containing T4SS effector [Bartonella taylorii]|uniref:BID domain-containing T4SS effector n=1 Tax=Bartonella taylorii TaxID=33046 RepID=UPI001ABA55C1|nr:BID domain-containing T4SS effector [Bartonella taylorii]
MTKEKTQNPTYTTQIELQEHHQSLDPEASKRLKTESKHFYYPRTKVYKNKYLITNQKTFAEVYSRDTKEMMAKLRAAPLPETIDSSYLKSIHQQIFSKTFAWAGRTRDERFKFPNGSVASMPSLKKKHFTKPFAAGEEIQRGLQKLDEMLLEKGDWQNLTREEFIEHTSQVMLHLYSLNPFREGNRHVIQLFAEKLGQKAGYTLDYSLVSRERKKLIRYEAVNNDNLDPIKHLLEDISNPDKMLILREFVDNMKKIGIDEKNCRATVVVREGHTYHGTYRGCGQEGFMIDVNGTFVVGHKKHLAPEQVKTLQIGDRFSFTAPFPQEVQKVLIPKETVPDLTNEELSQRVYENALVKRSMENIKTLCETVYGNKHALQNKLPEFKIPITHEDVEKGERLAQLIEQSPQSIHKLRGVGVCGLKNSARQHAKDNCLPLGQAVFQYIHAVKQVEKDTLESHSAEQKRCAKPVEMPSQKIKEFFFSSNKKREGIILSSSPELETQLQVYFRKLNERLSPSEHEAINEENHIKLAESLGIPVSQAQKIAETFRQTKEICGVIRQQHCEMRKEKERNVQQSVSSSDGEKSVEISTTQVNAENVVKFVKRNQTVEEKIPQNRQKSMAI